MDDDPEAYYAAYRKAKEKHLKSLLSKINVAALELAASQARDDIACYIPAFADHIDPPSQLDIVSSQCGGQNCHVEVKFADGVTWIARIRLNDPLLPPPSIQNYITLSEVATLTFLLETKVPAPRVYAYALESPDNAVGTSYILMEKVMGRPLDWDCATAEQRTRVMEQLADVYLELEQHPITLMGSPSPPPVPGKPGSVSIGRFAQMPCFETPEQGLGPFRTLKAAYTAILDLQIRMLASHEVSSLPVDNYLALRWRLNALEGLVASSKSREGPFYLKHADDKGDHIMIDEEYNITGIIDWEFASTEPWESAFSSPCFMWPVAKFYDGDDSLAPDEMEFASIFDQHGRRDIGGRIRGGRPWQRYLFFLGGGIPRDMSEFEPLFQGLRRSFMREDTKPISSYADWKADIWKEYIAGHDWIQALM